MMLLPDQMQGFQLSTVGKDKNWSWKRVRSNGLVSIQSKLCSLNIGETDKSGTYSKCRNMGAGQG